MPGELLKLQAIDPAAGLGSRNHTGLPPGGLEHWNDISRLLRWVSRADDQKENARLIGWLHHQLHHATIAARVCANCCSNAWTGTLSFHGSNAVWSARTCEKTRSDLA
jgi:hypothetical protein